MSDFKYWSTKIAEAVTLAPPSDKNLKKTKNVCESIDFITNLQSECFDGMHMCKTWASRQYI